MTGHAIPRSADQHQQTPCRSSRPTHTSTTITRRARRRTARTDSVPNTIHPEQIPTDQKVERGPEQPIWAKNAQVFTPGR